MTTNQAYASSITVKESSKPAGEPLEGLVYKYTEISSGIDQSAITSAKIQFKVPKAWIANNRIDKNAIELGRFVSNRWVLLETSKIAEDSTDITYEADTPGFSVFAVVGPPPPASMEGTAQLIVTAEGLSEFALWQLLVMIGMAAGIFSVIGRKKK